MTFFSSVETNLSARRQKTVSNTCRKVWELYQQINKSDAGENGDYDINDGNHNILQLAKKRKLTRILQVP
jgi:hypothetical protein